MNITANETHIRNFNPVTITIEVTSQDELNMLSELAAWNETIPRLFMGKKGRELATVFLDQLRNKLAQL